MKQVRVGALTISRTSHGLYINDGVGAICRVYQRAKYLAPTFATAPELLEVLREIEATASLTFPERKKIETAIAKATGQQ